MLSSQRSVASQTGQNRRRQICDRSRCDSTVFASQQARPCVRAPLRPCVGGSVRACVRASMRPCIRPRNLQRRWVIKTLLKASKLLMLRNVKTLQRLYKINDFDAVASNSSSSSKQQQQQQQAAAAAAASSSSSTQQQAAAAQAGASWRKLAQAGYASWRK